MISKFPASNTLAIIFNIELTVILLRIVSSLGISLVL